MRTILTIILITGAIFGMAQENLEGTYITRKKDIGFESDIFEFHEGGMFSYAFFTCTGTGFGKGRYRLIDGDSLQLQFSDCKKCQDFVQIETSKDIRDSLEIDLSIKSWLDGSDVPGANVFVVNPRKGTSTNINGKARLKIAIPSNNCTLRIQFIGYDPVEVEVTANTSQIKGIVYLSNHWVYNSTDIKTYKILQWTRSKMKLLRYPGRAVTYHKLKESKTNEFIRNRMGEAGYEMYMQKINTSVNSIK